MRSLFDDVVAQKVSEINARKHDEKKEDIATYVAVGGDGDTAYAPEHQWHKEDNYDDLWEDKSNRFYDPSTMERWLRRHDIKHARYVEERASMLAPVCSDIWLGYVDPYDALYSRR